MTRILKTLGIFAGGFFSGCFYTGLQVGLGVIVP